jgi:hypothetical protein
MPSFRTIAFQAALTVGAMYLLNAVAESTGGQVATVIQGQGPVERAFHTVTFHVFEA